MKKDKIKGSEGIQGENASGRSEAQLRYAAVFDQSPDGILIIDAEGKMIDFNRAAHADLGYSREEFSKLSISDIDPLESPAEIRAHIKKTIGEKKAQFEVTLRTKSGQLRNVLVITQTIILSGRTVLHTIWRDITDQKTSEKALLESEAKYRDIFEKASDAIFVLDSELRYVDVNGRGLDILGYTREELLGRQPFDFIPEEQRPRSAAEFDRLKRTGSYQAFEGRMLTKDGRWIDIEVSSTAIFKDGVFIGSRDIVRDITERKKAEKAVSESEKRFRAAFENISVGASMADLKGRFIKVNRVLCNLLGYSEEELLSMTFSDITHPDDVQIGLDAVKKLVSGDSDYTSFEKRYLRKDGQVMNVIISPAIIRDDEGTPLHFVALFQDITARKKAAEAKDGLLKAISAATEGIAITDNKDRFVYVNDAHARIFGCLQHELIGKTWRDTAMPELEALIEKDLSKTLHNRAVGIWSGEFPALRKDGTILPTEVTAASRWDETGNYLGHICIVRDISERKQAEEALRESEERFKSLFESAPDAILVADMKSGVVVDANPMASKLLKLPRDKIIGLHQSQLHPPGIRENSKEAFAEHVREAGQGIQTRPIEIAVLCSNGDEIPVESMAKIVTIQGKHYLMGIFRDISERKKAEGKMKSALAEKETLLRELYHRTKNNMQVITSLLNLQSQAIDDKKTLQVLEDTKNRIHSMALVHEKLYKTRDLSQVNLRDYIADLTASLMDSHQFIKGKISLLLDIDNIPVSIDTMTPCGLVLNELMTNTLKYAFPDNRAGKITVSAHLNAEGIIELRFSDDGIGLPEGLDLEKPKSLGLKLVRVLVETQLKGKMAIKRERGTGFVISFKAMDKRKRI